MPSAAGSTWSLSLSRRAEYGGPGPARPDRVQRESSCLKVLLSLANRLPQAIEVQRTGLAACILHLGWSTFPFMVWWQVSLSHLTAFMCSSH